MAKKKKPAPEPEAAPEAADEAPDYGPALAEAAREAVEEGIEAAFARAEQNELDKLAPAFVAADLMRQLNIAVAWATLEPDRPTAAQLAAAPAEPAPPIIDSWARGVVASRPRPRPRTPPPAADAAASEGPPSSRTSARSARSRTGRKRAPRAPAGGPVLLDVEEEDWGMAVGAYAFAETTQFNWPEAEDARPKSARALAARAARDRLDEEEQRVAAQLRALKQRGRAAVVLPGGAVCELKPLDKAPAPPAFKVRAPAAPRAPRARAAAPGKKPPREKAHVAAARRFFVGGLEQPPLLSGDSGFGPGVGVAAAQGAKRVEGMARQRDASHLSRAEYESLRDEEEGSLFAESRLDADVETRARSPVTVDGGAGAGAGDDDDDDDDDATAARRRRAAAAAAALPGDAVSPLAGGKPRVPTPEAAPGGGADDEDDENLKLVGAPDWGAVGAAKEPVVGRLGARQSPAQRAQTFNLLSGAHLAPQARVRVAAAPPTRSLFEYSVPPPGVSELGAHLFAEVSPKKPLPGTRPTLGVAGGRAN